MDADTATTFDPIPEDPPAAGPLRQFFGVVASGRTYLNLLYIWLAFPLGLAYFVFLVTGFSLGAGLAIILWGLLLLGLVLWAVYGLAAFERVLAIALLGAAPPPMVVASRPGASPMARFTAMLGSASLWKGLLFLAVKFPLGLATWTLSLISLAVSAALILAPWAWASRGVIDFWFFVVEGLAGAMVVSVIGVFMMILTLHFNNAMAWLWARSAELLLGSAPRVIPPAAPALAPSAA